MPQRHVLFVDNASLTAYRVDGGTVAAAVRFLPDPAGQQAFADYLAQRRGSVFLMLIDIVEEGFLSEDIPHSNRQDRDAIIGRKLAQHFYGTPYALALPQGRLKTGRRDERLLLMALTQPQHLDPWLAIMRGQQAILAGIWSLPQVIGRLLTKQAPSQLLVLTQTHAGLRQTFFIDGQLRFSRLTPLIRDTADSAAIAAAGEAIKMHQYLSSQRLIERGSPLATWVLAHPGEAAAMRTRCRDNTGLRFEIVDLTQAAQRAGLRDLPANSCAEPLFCRLLAQRPPAVQFAPEPERAYHRLWRTRFVLKAASLLVFLGGLLFAGLCGLDIIARQDSIETLRQQARIDEGRYAAKLQALPRIPLGNDELRQLIDRYEQVEKRAVGPTPLLIQLSQSLDAFPPVAIDRLEWSIAEQLTPAGNSMGGAAAANATAVTAQLASGPYAQVTVTAQLPASMVGDQRGQLNLVANFVKHLGMAPATLVTMLQPPVDTQSGKTLKSGDERGTPEAPRFVFRLTRKL